MGTAEWLALLKAAAQDTHQETAEVFWAYPRVAKTPALLNDEGDGAPIATAQAGQREMDIGAILSGYERLGLGEAGRQIKQQIVNGADPEVLAHKLPLLEWVVEAGETEKNRQLVEVPDRFAIARWRRDADVAEIARSILGTLKYEPHGADTAALREALHLLVVTAGRGDSL